MTAFLRQAFVAVRLLAVMTLLLGVIYPVAVFAVGRLAADRTDGSWLTDSSGNVVGSSLIGQDFAGAQWFQSRPSAAGDGYDGLASGGSNLGPNNPDLIAAVTQRQQAVQQVSGAAEVPPDAVTASGSGLDPHISPEYARLQIDAVARARGLDRGVVAELVDEHTEGRLLGFIGEPRVNVLELNLALEGL